MTGLGSNPSQARRKTAISISKGWSAQPPEVCAASSTGELRRVWKLSRSVKICEADTHCSYLSWKRRSTKLNICPIMLSSFACLSRCSTQCISGTGETEVPRRNSSSHTALRWILSISHRKGEKGHERCWIPQSMVPEDPTAPVKLRKLAELRIHDRLEVLKALPSTKNEAQSRIWRGLAISIGLSLLAELATKS